MLSLCVWLSSRVCARGGRTFTFCVCRASSVISKQVDEIWRTGAKPVRAEGLYPQLRAAVERPQEQIYQETDKRLRTENQPRMR